MTELFPPDTILYREILYYISFQGFMSPCLKIILPCEYFRMFLSCCPKASQGVRKRKIHAIVSYPAVYGTLKASLKLNRIVLKDQLQQKAQ